MATVVSSPPALRQPQRPEGFPQHRSSPPPPLFQALGLAEDPRRFRAAARCLRRSGLVVIQGAVGPDELAALQPVVAAARAHAASPAAGDGSARVLLNRGGQRAIRGYRRMVDSAKAVISVRDDEDGGMVDVFHPELLLESCTENVVGALQDSLVTGLLERAFRRPFRVHVRNLYLNAGVTTTRGLHTDGGGIKAKAFLYLSDVTSLAEGPFCYVPGSHRMPWLRGLNRLCNARRGRRRDDCPILLGLKPIPVFCRAGDMVVAMQQGVHRGHPQAPWAERAVLLSMLQPSG
ncbi:MULTISPECIES: hypothetical protein [Aphanothece]|uniref:hypothetical protein n=1 Tax=Aphanothece TaxID=1121 RepID=UPI0039856AD9